MFRENYHIGPSTKQDLCWLIPTGTHPSATPMEVAVVERQAMISTENCGALALKLGLALVMLCASHVHFPNLRPGQSMASLGCRNLMCVCVCASNLGPRLVSPWL